MSKRAHTVLFVCTANRARSPMAEACFRRELAARGEEAGWRVESAGTWTMDGLTALPEAMEAAKRMGLDLDGHRSSVITKDAITRADLVLVMEQGHKEALAAEFPRGAKKVHLLSEAATGDEYNVSDPVTSEAEGDVYAEIAELIRVGFDRIRELASKT